MEAEVNQFVTLVVEDDAMQRDVLSELLKDEGLEVVECANAEAAELIISAAGPELLVLVTDVNLAGKMTGVELAEFAKDKFPTLTVVVLSGKPAPNLPQNIRFLSKPYEPRELLAAILS
jgi:CheY-like chemotaxis protein